MIEEYREDHIYDKLITLSEEQFLKILKSFYKRIELKDA